MGHNIDDFREKDGIDKLEKMLKIARLESFIEKIKSMITQIKIEIEANKEDESWIFRTERMKEIERYELELIKAKLELEIFN